jgi:hypothetical protein
VQQGPAQQVGLPAEALHERRRGEPARPGERGEGERLRTAGVQHVEGGVEDVRVGDLLATGHGSPSQAGGAVDAADPARPAGSGL